MNNMTNNVDTKKEKSWLGRLKHFLSELFFPEKFKCVFCGADVPDFDNDPICDECKKLLPFNNGNKCQICSEPIDNEATVCDSCQLHKKNFKKAFCPFIYEGKVRSSILGYKDSNRRYLAKSFAKFIAEEIKKSGIEIDYVTFTPLTDKKKKKRGFDQAEMLALYVSKELGYEMVSLFEKTRDGKTQKKLTYKERQENMVGMYKLLPHKFHKTDNVLIVDDIITTGATIDACAKLICKRVENVYVAAVARNKLKKNKKAGE